MIQVGIKACIVQNETGSQDYLIQIDPSMDNNSEKETLGEEILEEKCNFRE